MTTRQVSHKGKSIERENDGLYSVYFIGNAYATRGGFKSIEDAKAFVDQIGA